MTDNFTDVQMVPVHAINVINPRPRNKKVFNELITSIAHLGLKKPITVSRNARNTGYDLVCGQGRLEAFIALGEKEIPAIVVEASEEDCYVMSLVENLAPRNHSPLELMREIGALKARGYTTGEIAKKTDFSEEYVYAVCYLLEHGEDRLLAAVDRGVMPPSIAMVLPLSKILPLRSVSAAVRKTSRFRRIAASIAEVGIIEPLVVARPKAKGEGYLRLDGHMRLAILGDLGVAEVSCLVADDDEAFTYNKRINRLSTIYEHFMLVRALDRGVAAERLAKALNVNCEHIRRRETLLDGICPEVVEMLKDKTVSPATFETLRKMKPMRQIEATELMSAAGNFSLSYARALLAGSRQQDLVRPDRPKKVGGLSPDQMERMEREMEAVQRDFKAVEASYGDDVLHLVIATGYLGKLIGNPAINRYMIQHHPEILEEFRSIIAGASLDQASAAA